VKTWAIVPVKRLREAKSRLSSILTRNQRATLGRALLAHTLDVLAARANLAGVLVVSADATALMLAKGKGALSLMESEAGMNTALAQAAAWALAHGAEATLVLPADLPLLTPKDVAELLALAEPTPAVVLAPDRREQGTNALLSTPPGLIPYLFGPGSFARHTQACEARGVLYRIYRSPRVAFDIDLPEDLREWVGSL
jgi:2-phospho-L-lactate guanylyltransferase